MEKGRYAKAAEFFRWIGCGIVERMIAEGGIVYGCAFEKPFSIKHIRCSSADELEKLKSSKYVQSNLAGIHSQIANDLKNGKKYYSSVHHVK